MTLRSKILVLFAGLALAQAGFAADSKTAGTFKPGPATSYPNHQTSEKVTIAAVPFDNPEQVKEIFGKADLVRFGVLPVLVVIQNDTGKALRLEDLVVELIGPGREKIEATPAEEIRFLAGGKRPKDKKLPYPIPTGKKKSPLEAWEITGRAFSARMLPPGDTANGFFYFQSVLKPQSLVYLTGMREAATGRELLYFEIPVEPSNSTR